VIGGGGLNNKSKEELQLEAMRLLHESNKELRSGMESLIMCCCELTEKIKGLEEKVEHLNKTL